MGSDQISKAYIRKLIIFAIVSLLKTLENPEKGMAFINRIENSMVISNATELGFSNRPITLIVFKNHLSLYY